MQFVDYRLAIGDLVLAGINVKFDKLTQTLVEVNDEGRQAGIVYCFRDGATYKVEQETVQDYIDDRQRRVKNLPACCRSAISG